LSGKPLVFYLARATVARESAEGRWRFEQRWQEAGFRRGIRQLTLWWGMGLTWKQYCVPCLVSTMPVERFLLLSPFVSYGLMSLMLADLAGRSRCVLTPRQWWGKHKKRGRPGRRP
jgi:hypothetical protein